jgi:SpoVK/Ycf46/Vps4 family AAA+-type ATPase
VKYSIEIGKIVEGALKHDKLKVINYTKQLISKLEEDEEIRAANKFNKMLIMQNDTSLSTMGINKDFTIPVDSESRTNLADIIYPDNNNIEVILSKRNTDDLKSFVLNYKNADKLNAIGIGVSNALLLYGPPGCGKTKCAYLIAKELNLPLIVARLDSLISSYLGTTAKNIRSLFEFAQKTPCVLFLDEFDSIAKARDDSNELGELKRVVNSLLQNVDAMSNDSLLIAATNHDQLLDPAVWRRFDYKLEINCPDKEAIGKLIDLFTKGVLEYTEKEKKELETVFYGLSGSNIEEIITKSLRDSIISNIELSKNAIYDEYFNFKKIIPQENRDDKEIMKLKARYLRDFDDKIFSYAVIAEILNVSKTTVSNLLKEEE